MGRKPAPGEKLQELFSKSDQDFLDEVFSSQQSDPGPRQLYLNSLDNKSIPVGAELCPMDKGGQRQGWVVALIDLSHRSQMEQGIFENLPVGLAHVDLEGYFQYANRKFLKLLGIDDQDWRGKALQDFLPDPVNRAVLENQLKNRQQGKCGEYKLSFTRKSGYKVPVKIYAVTETDLAGKPLGSVGIVRSLEHEEAVARMYKYVATLRYPWREMLTLVIQEVKPFLPYDLCIVSEIGPQQKHIRSLFLEPSSIEPMYRKFGRWETPDDMARWLNEQRDIYSEDLVTFLARFPGVIEKSEVQGFLQQGYRSFLRLPVIQDELIAEPIASVSFFSKENPYDETSRRLLRVMALPLENAVRL